MRVYQQHLADPHAAGLDADATLRHVIGVIGGCGGSGATTFALVLAQAAATAAIVLDADPLGPGSAHALNLADRGGLTWDDLNHTSGDMPPGALKSATARRGNVHVVSSGLKATTPTTDAVTSLVSTPDFRCLIVDLGRSLDLIQSWRHHLTYTVLVCPARARAVWSARKLTTSNWLVRCGLVVPRPPGATVTSLDIARALEVPLIADYRWRRADVHRIDMAGIPGAAPVRRAAGTVWALLERRGTGSQQ